jgi:Protein of unknown function (DUF3341)
MSGHSTIQSSPIFGLMAEYSTAEALVHAATESKKAGYRVMDAYTAYPLNIGGRPLISAPMFIPITFECTILAAGLTSAIGMLLLNGLPLFYHPVFNVPAFARASQDGFFLCIEATDPHFDRHDTAAFLESTGADEVSEVAH